MEENGGITVPVVSKLSDVVKNDVVKKGVYNAKIKNFEDKIPDITNLATTTAVTAVENKVLDHSKFITTPEFNKLTAKNLLLNKHKQIQQAKIMLKKQTLMIN